MHVVIHRVFSHSFPAIRLLSVGFKRTIKASIAKEVKVIRLARQCKLPTWNPNCTWKIIGAGFTSFSCTYPCAPLWRHCICFVCVAAVQLKSSTRSFVHLPKGSPKKHYQLATFLKAYYQTPSGWKFSAFLSSSSFFFSLLVGFIRLWQSGMVLLIYFQCRRYFDCWGFTGWNPNI